MSAQTVLQTYGYLNSRREHSLTDRGCVFELRPGGEIQVTVRHSLESSNMDDHLRDMALYVEVVKARGFRVAAETLGMPNSTLSRRITALEKSIGLRLLNRTTRRLEMTEAGQSYYERCRRIVDEARVAHEELGGMASNPSGVLRVSLPVDFAVTYLAPLLAEFASLHPTLRFHLDLTPRRVDLVSEPFDIAVRIGESRDSQLVSRLLTTLTPALYASPEYLEAMGEPSVPEDLRNHQCLHMPQSARWTLTNGSEVVTLPVGGRFVLNNVGLLGQLAASHLGLVLLAPEIVADEVAAGALRRVMPMWHGAPQRICAITESRLLPARTKRFIEFLQDRLSR